MQLCITVLTVGELLVQGVSRLGFSSAKQHNMQALWGLTGTNWKFPILDIKHCRTAAKGVIPMLLVADDLTVSPQSLLHPGDALMLSGRVLKTGGQREQTTPLHSRPIVQFLMHLPMSRCSTSATTTSVHRLNSRIVRDHLLAPSYQASTTEAPLACYDLEYSVGVRAERGSRNLL